METSQPGQSEQPSHRSLKDLRRDGVRVLFSPAAKRLFWPLDGVFPTAISVMKTPRSADDLEPFFRPDTGGDGGGTWHEISQLPLTEPKVSSLEASVYDLEQWEYDWIEWHKDHDAPAFDQEFVAYGDLDDDVRPYADEAKEGGSWEEEEDTEFLVKCCGDDRPLRKRGLKLVVTPSAGSDSFVTMQDYVSAVHPWLMGLRGEILQAKTIARPQPYPVSPSIKWMVDEGPEHKTEEKVGWVRDHGPVRVVALPPAFERYLRAKRNR